MGAVEAGSLPVEVWRLILTYLALPDLGRCSRVCRAWRALVLSLDRTHWRQLYLRQCRHPNWPAQPHLEPASWREALREHTLASRAWTRHRPPAGSSARLHLFRRPRSRRAWRVGPGREHKTLREALSAAGPYDRVLLHPGVHEERVELTLRLPVEIAGEGKLGSVSLLACIDQQCPTARLCNLVLMPTCFSPVVYKTALGHVQLDNCSVEGGQLQVQGPGTCHARFCSFGPGSRAHFLGVAVSLLDSCNFSGSDAASVTVEGPPTSDRNWACRHLAAWARAAQPDCTDAPRSLRPPGVAPTLGGLCGKWAELTPRRCGGHGAGGVGAGHRDRRQLQ